MTSREWPRTNNRSTIASETWLSQWSVVLQSAPMFVIFWRERYIVSFSPARGEKYKQTNKCMWKEKKGRWFCLFGGDKRPRVHKRTLYTPKKKGGLGVPDLLKYFYAAQLAQLDSHSLHPHPLLDEGGITLLFLWANMTYYVAPSKGAITNHVPFPIIRFGNIGQTL